MKNWVTFFKKKKNKEQWLKPKQGYFTPPPAPTMVFSPIHTPQNWDVVDKTWREEYHMDEFISQAEFL